MSFEEQLSGAKGEARAKFEQQLKTSYRGYAQEYARQTGRYPHPRKVEEWRASARQRFEASLSEWETTEKANYAKAKQEAEIQQQMQEQQAYAEWKAGIIEQYPSDKYIVKWTEQGATIFEKSEPRIAQDINKMKAQQYETKMQPLMEEAKAVKEWQYALRTQYPPEQYKITFPEPGQALIYERVSSVPVPSRTQFQIGVAKAQQYELKQIQQLTGMALHRPPTPVQHAMFKAEQFEAKQTQLQEQMQVPTYGPQKVSLFYVEEKGKRRGVEVGPIEMARQYAYYHPEKVWKVPYLYKSIRAFGKWLETTHETPYGKMLMPSGARQVYLISGFVKGAESLVRPEIRTAGSLLLMEPLGLITGRPLGEATGVYAETIKGYEPELLGELVFDYVFGTYVLGPLVGKAASGIKRGAAWAGEKVASYITETQAYQYILEPAWRTGKEAFMAYGLEPAWRGVKAYGVEPALRGIKTYVYEPLVYGVTTYGYEPLRRGAEAWAFTYGLEPLKRGLTTYAYEPMKQAFVTYALPPIKETQIYVKSVLTPYIKEQIEKYGIEPVKRGLSQYVIEPAKHEIRAMISPLPDWYKELKYGIQFRAWAIHPVAKEAYLGIRPTLGVVDLPYRGLMGEIPKGTIPYVTSKGMMLLTEQMTKQAAETTAKMALPKAIEAFVGVTVVKAPTILHAWKGEPYPFVTMKDVGKTVKPYPLEKFEYKPYPKALETLYPYQIEKWSTKEEQKQKSKIITKLMPSPDQIQRELQEVTQVSLSKTKTALIQTPAIAQIPQAISMEKQMIQQTQRLKQIQIQKTIMKTEWPPEMFELSKAKRRRKRGKLEYPFGRYKRFYPVMGGRQALKELMGI